MTWFEIIERTPLTGEIKISFATGLDSTSLFCSTCTCTDWRLLLHTLESLMRKTSHWLKSLNINTKEKDSPLYNTKFKENIYNK